MRYKARHEQDNKRQRAGPAQQHCDSFRFRRRRAAFYNGLKSKVGLAAATGKTAAYADQSQHRRNVVTVPRVARGHRQTVSAFTSVGYSNSSSSSAAGPSSPYRPLLTP